MDFPAHCLTGVRDELVAVQQIDSGGAKPPAISLFQSLHKGALNVKKVNMLLVVLVVVTLSIGRLTVAKAGEAPAKASLEKAVPQKVEPVKTEEKAEEAKPEKQATLTLMPGEKNTFGIDLNNSVPVRGIQFTVSGLKMTEVHTASRTAGFLAKFNEETGIVILVSTAADEIAPGKGPVLKILGEKVPDTEVSLTKIMIADSNRNLIE